MRLKAALVIMLFGTVSCLQLLDECMPKNFIDTHVKGSEMKLRVWVPEIGDASLLTLISESDWTSMARKIEIWKNVITVQTQDGHTVSPEHELPIQKSLPHGWVNFMVTSNENFTVTVPDVNLTLIDVQDVVQGNYIVIIGSSVTVNCMLPTNQWEVSTHQNAIIPLSPNGSHDFSLFSRTPYAPMLTISNLPWLFDDFKSEPQLLFPFSSYNFTVDCAIDEKLGSCYIPAGVSKGLLGSFPREATSLSMTATGLGNYTIIQDIRKGPDQEGGSTKRFIVEDQHVRVNLIAMVVLIVATLSLLFFKKCKGRAERREL